MKTSCPRTPPYPEVRAIAGRFFCLLPECSGCQRRDRLGTTTCDRDSAWINGKGPDSRQRHFAAGASLAVAGNRARRFVLNLIAVRQSLGGFGGKSGGERRARDGFFAHSRFKTKESDAFTHYWPFTCRHPARTQRRTTGAEAEPRSPALALRRKSSARSMRHPPMPATLCWSSCNSS